MTFQSIAQLFTLLFATLIVAGCGKSTTDPKTHRDVEPPISDLRSPTASDPSFRLHWLGKKRLSSESNATNFVSIWNMPESLSLETQTLDKLSTAPWRLLATTTSLTNAPVALMRPLLDDLVQEESYLEAAPGTNCFSEIVLAIKLPPDRAALWRSNLPIILNSFSAKVSAAPANFSLEALGMRFTVTNIGAWTLLSMAPSISHQLCTIKIASRLNTTGIPFVQETTNFWISGRIDFSSMSHAFGWNLKSNSNLPVCEYSVTGESGNVRTMAKLTFPNKAPIQLEPWNIPTNLVHDPLIGFMAARGFRPFLKSLAMWNEQTLGSSPNQIIFWTQAGSPAFRFFALPTNLANEQMHLFSTFIYDYVNPHFATNPNRQNMPLGAFENVPGTLRLRWRGVPFFSPNLDVIKVTDKNMFIVGGLFQNWLVERPAPNGLLEQFQTESNLVLYDWEITQPCQYGLIQISQMGRLLFGRARLSMTNNAALPWLVALSPRLGTANTTGRLVTPETLVFSRSSTIGMSGIEMHLLTEWLESPVFPINVFSIASKPVPPIPPRSTP